MNKQTVVTVKEQMDHIIQLLQAFLVLALAIVSEGVIIDARYSKFSTYKHGLPKVLREALSDRTYSYIDVKRYFDPNIFTQKPQKAKIIERKVTEIEFTPGFIPSKSHRGYLIPNYETPNIPAYVSPAVRVAASYARVGAAPIPLSGYHVEYPEGEVTFYKE